MPSSTPFSSNNAILNDTSLAAVANFNGDRHVFFQDQSWSIRECIFTLSSGKWSTLTTNIVAVDAKEYSPMSAILLPLVQKGDYSTIRVSGQILLGKCTDPCYSCIYSTYTKTIVLYFNVMILI